MRSLLGYSTTSTLEEKLTLRIKANNDGDIYLPTAGYSTDGTQTCEYDWVVSIDGNDGVDYNGVGSSTGKMRVGYGLTPLSVHTVIITPKEEEYGWLRAFGYKGTDIASSLINIISDKSYMGYAVSSVFTGNYYKAYQYYGCTNLINTDEELLPDTLEIIGDNYRAYEYSGCTSLVSNAEEKILKTVKVIGDNYRTYQYQNCSNINRIDMRAINWAGVGTNYRLAQFDNMGNDRKPLDVYIEGGIEEGGNWGLVDNNVKGVYVYEGLVNDYKTKLNGVVTATKIQKNAEWDNNEYEFIEYIALADSNGVIRVPVAGISTANGQNCAYDWYISIDGGIAVQYTGTGGTTYLSVGSGLIEGSEHRVVIKPTTVSWGWGRAFGFFGSGAEGYIKELIHDSYKCYAISRTDTGDYYKADTYTACANLINSYEKLPTSVTTIGNNYMANCYAGCTGLKTAFWEILHKGISIGSNYRSMEYTGCSAMEIHKGICGYIGTYPTNYKYEYLSGAGDDLVVYISRYEELASGLTNSMGLADANVSEIYVEEWYNFEYVRSNYWSNITDTKFKAKYYNYVVHQFYNLDEYVFIGSQGLSSPKRDGYYNMGINYGFAIGPGEKAIYTGLHYSTDSYSYPGIMEFKFGTPGDLTTVSTRTNYLTLGSQGYIRGLDKVNGKLYCDYYETSGEQLYEKKGILPGGLLSGISFTRTLLWSRPGNGGTYQGFAISKEELYRYWGYDNPNEGQNYPKYRGDYKLVRFWNSPTYNYINMRFSDDGYIGYLNGSQYSLTIPFNVNTATKVEGITGPSGQYSFTTNGKRLYVLNGGTVSLYEYQG